MADPRPIIQYQAIADPPVPPAASVQGAAPPPTDQILPGPWFDYMGYVEPLQVPTTVGPVVPDGVAAWASQIPAYTLRRRVLPEQGTMAMPVLTPLVGGSALSWVPVYAGKRGLKAFQQQDHTDAALWTVPTSTTAPPITATLPRYPDYQLRRAAVPNVAGGTTWVPLPITPAPPPVQRQHLDTRRRQLLLVRRLVR